MIETQNPAGGTWWQVGLDAAVHPPSCRAHIATEMTRSLLPPSSCACSSLLSDDLLVSAVQRWANVDSLPSEEVRHLHLR